MQTLYVELGERRYPIFIGSDLDPKALLEPYIQGRQVMIVSNETIAPLYLARYVAAIEALGKQLQPVFCLMEKNIRILSTST